MPRKKKKKPNLLRMLCTIVLVVLLGSFAYMYINQEIVIAQQKEQISQMQSVNQKLADEWQRMLEKVEDKSTLDYISQYMRSHFGMVQDGEIRVDIVEE